MRIFNRVMIFLIFTSLLLSNGYAMVIINPPLPDKICRTPVIADGYIKITDGKTVLLVDRFLKGTASNVIEVKSSWSWNISLNVSDGERVILFLSNLNGDGTEARLYGASLSKWPNDIKHPNGPMTYVTGDIDRFGMVINSIKYALAGKDFEDRARRIISMIQSDDEMIQLAGLQLVSSSAFHETLGDGSNLLSIRQIAAFALPRLKSKNPDIRIEAAVVTRYAPTSVAAPALIPLLTDNGQSVSQRVAIVLGKIFTSAKYPMPSIASSTPERPSDLSALKTDDGRQLARSQCELLWDEKADDQIAKDLERLRKNLESDSELEGESAKIYLNILEGSGVTK